MLDRGMVEEVLLGVISPEFIKMWWDLKLPGLDYCTPNEVWAKDPHHVLEYAREWRLDGDPA